MQTLTVSSAAPQAIPFPTSERANAVAAIAAYLAMLRGLPETRLAIAGNGSAIVQVPDRASHLYARLGGASGNVIEARLINLLNPANDDALLVRRERPGGPAGWIVLDWLGTGAPPLLICEECETTGTPTASGNVSYSTSAYTVGKFSMVEYPYVYALSSKFSSGGGTADIRLDVIDVSDPTTPVVVGTATYNYVDFDPDFYASAIPSGMGKRGDYVYVPLLRTSDSQELATQVFRFNVSDPTAPALEWDTNAFDNAGYWGMELFAYAPDSSLNAIVIARDNTTPLGHYSLTVLEITGSAAVFRSSVAAPALTTGWRTAVQEWDVKGQYFYGQRTSATIDIVDATDPDAPVVLNSFSPAHTTPGFGLRVSADSQQLWVGRLANESTGYPYLEGWDISDKMSPAALSDTLLGTTTSQRVLDLVLCGNERLFTIQSTPDIRAWDTLPGAPNESGTLAITNFSPSEIHLVGAYLYVNGTLSGVPNLQVVAG